jgi:xylulokinase
VGAGTWRSVPEACQATIRVVSRTEPQADQVTTYNELYPLYRDLYPALKPTFQAVADEA